MFQNIAVAYDQSSEAERALQTAIPLAKALGSNLHTVTFAEELPAYTAYGVAGDPSVLRTLGEDRDKFYGDLQKRAQEMASAKSVQVVTHLLDGEKVDGIIQFVSEQKIDLLVVGLHHRSLRVSRLWSTVYTLAQEIRCSILGVH